LPGFSHIEGNKVFFNNIDKDVTNADVISVLQDVNELLKTKKNITDHPVVYYENFMARILNVGILFSSFIECIFANMFLTNKDPNEFWRYNQNNKIIFKAGKINLAYLVNPRLSCLFQPNAKTLKYLDTKPTIKTFYEKIFDQTIF